VVAALRHQLSSGQFEGGQLTVAGYAAVVPEPDLGPLFERLTPLIGWLLPALRPRPGRAAGQPDWAVWDGRSKLVSTWRGIPEPTAPPLGAAGLAAADVILLPGLAGTRGGARLGSGGSWYDWALAQARPQARRWLLLNSEEVVAELPTDQWDEPVDALVTEMGLIACPDRLGDVLLS